MTLVAGSRLGAYRIVALLGAGGMGEVYRAHDSRLRRDVAIKVLPKAWSADADRLRRFEHEARAAAALNHPHICAIYDVGRDDATDYLVLELLAGETLADRLTHGPLPLGEALKAAREIAGALDKAHRAGIVHRDLKPGNIMLTKGGIKLLDFGLAKLRPPGPMASERSLAATATDLLTRQGTIVGTLPYMAPEQTEGGEVDARADIWAFGCVLYEMIAGRPAFAAETQGRLIGAILRDHPPALSSVQQEVPSALDRIAATCLAKDRDERWQSAHDLVTVLNWPSDAKFSITNASAAAARPRVWSRTSAVAVMVTLIMLATGIFTRTRNPVATPTVIRFQVQAPRISILGVGPSLALSPDGRSIAFVAIDTNGVRRLHVRGLDSNIVRPFPQVREPLEIAWSPDSRRIAFVTGGRELRTVDLAEGTTQTLSEVPALRSGLMWGPTGEIVFGSPPGPDAGLYALAPGSAMLRRIMSGAGVGFLFPTFADEGRLIIYLEQREQNRRVCVASRDGEVQGCTPLATTTIAYTGSGHLVFARDATVLAQRFDPARAALIGEPVVVAEQVDGYQGGSRFFSVTPGSLPILAYFSAGPQQTSRFAWFDRSGKPIADVGAPAPYTGGFDLSADARYIVALRGAEREAWVTDTRGVATRVDEAAGTRNSGDVVWAPDGSRFARVAPSAGAIIQQPAFGGQPDSLVRRSDADAIGLEDWSRDGRYLAITVLGGGRRRAEAQPVDGGKPIVLAESTALIDEQHFSPDGKWVVYNADDQGSHEVYLMPFPPNGTRWQVSTGGGVSGRWRDDSRELYFLALDGTLMAVSVAPGTPPKTGTPMPLFKTGIIPSYNLDHYAPAPDGQRFLLRLPVGGADFSLLNITVNWTSALPK